jgi:2'-5' RNA ligase
LSTHEPLRVFFAVELNAELRRALSQLMDELKQEPWGHRVKWIFPENLHVTLRFLGIIDPTLIPTLVKHTSKATAKIQTFPLQLHNIRFFPSPTAPRAIATDIIPTSELFELANTLEMVAANFGFTPETKPYLPHLTLGRIVHQHAPNLREDRTAPDLYAAGTYPLSNVHYRHETG